MTSPKRQVAKLFKQYHYPTYQLYAMMGNKKTSAQDGLRLAALTTMKWLCQRLGDETPEPLRQIPGPAEYQTAGDSCLVSLHISQGFAIDIVSLRDQGMWSLQITEPDLGSDPGNPEQSRSAVPGRTIETNVGYHINGNQLECGFQIMVTDLEETSQKADVQQLSFVDELVKNPDFGLKQITPLTQDVIEVASVSQLKNLVNAWHSDSNELPSVIFTHLRTKIELPALPKRVTMAEVELPMMPDPPEVTKSEDTPYDIEHFSQMGTTLCRTYLLADDLLERFGALTKTDAKPGDIVVLEPERFGGATRLYPYKTNKTRQDETLEKLRDDIYSYARSRSVSFGQIVFLSTQRKNLIQDAELLRQESEELSQEWEQEFSLQETKWKAVLHAKDEELQALSDQLERQKRYTDRIEREKEQMREERAEEQTRTRALIAKKQEDVAYLRRKLSQPQDHSGVAAWAAKYFQGRLILHPKAAALLEDKSAKSVNLELTCDALDFLATDYWEQRYNRISNEEMRSRCSEKYGRPFEIKHTGNATIDYTPTQYKIKYFENGQGKPVESPLDYHLGVGNAPENLLRIYFLHDDVNQLIVVGSLPRHLKAVTIR